MDIINFLTKEEKNTRYGIFATTSRLISCLILEDLVTAYFIPTTGFDNDDANSKGVVGFCLIFGLGYIEDTTTASLSISKNQGHYSATDKSANDNLYAAIPLQGLPQLNLKNCTHIGSSTVSYYKIENLTPWDILAPFIFGIATHTISRNDKKHNETNDTRSTAQPNNMAYYIFEVIRSTLGAEIISSIDSIIDCYDATQLWERFAVDYDVPPKYADLILSDCTSSMINQIYMYNNPKRLPTFESSPDEWEQALLEGHPLFPMHKSLFDFKLTPQQLSQTDVNYMETLENPKIRLISMPIDRMEIYGDFINACSPLIDAILAKTGESIQEKYSNRLLLPVHEFQVGYIQEKIKEAIILPEENYVKAQGLSSVRSVAVPGILNGITVKFSVGMRIGGSTRIISSSQARFAHVFSKDIASRISYDRDILTIQYEPASAVYTDTDENIAGQCSCIIRDAKEFLQPNNSQYVYVTAAALMEKIQKPDTDETLVTHIWNLETEDQRVKFLDRYVYLLLRAFIPPCRDNGLIFEPHTQNTIACFSHTTGKLEGFMIRDLDGIEVHYETFRETAGVDGVEDIIPKVESLEQLYASFNFSIFQTHLQPLIRLLGLYHTGHGWHSVRVHFSKLVPNDHPMYKLFMEKTNIPTYCYLRARLGQGTNPPNYDVYRLKPNPLLCNQ
ncbi:IucC family-domain-containing protein [Phascolomyces articulosus]|uniref:IucC family-domain-containing protein n=1 Tax=Phascolomyces articulosus TaxID=60185 RepID=A0AAD5KMD3_9FUNG|nr:IucC family-domain-containing protein [Phascolomyces articulosus]